MDLTLIKLLEKCKHCIEDLDKYNYFDNDILHVTVKVWDMSNISNSKIKLPNYLQTNIKLIRTKRSYHTTNCKKTILPP